MLSLSIEVRLLFTERHLFMNHDPSVLSTLSETEEALLTGITSYELEEQERALIRYREWVQKQYENKKEEEYPSVADQVFHILQSFFGGKREYEVIGFVKLTDIVLDYPKIIAGKLPLIVSLLIEVVRGDVTSNMVFPLVKVVIGLECHV